MKKLSPMLLRVVLVLLGAVLIYLGINVGFGGIRTLGWQVGPDFLEVTNEADFLVQDNHTRFLGGMLGALGLFLIFATTDLKSHRQALNLSFFLIFIGGLMRFTTGSGAVVFGGDVVFSLAVEILLMPALYIWLTYYVNETAESPT